MKTAPLKFRLAWMLGCILFNACAAPRASDAPAPSRRLLNVYVTVYALRDTLVRPLLLDRQGRRTGWSVDRPIWQIPGCLYQAGSEDGIPDPNAPEDTTEQAPADAVPGGPRPLSQYHDFGIFQPLALDSANLPGLLSEGGCELRLDPVAAGHVRLAIVGTGAGLEQCQDTTSVTVRAGLPSRWWLSWRAAEGRCTVAISRMSSGNSSEPVK